MDNRAQKKLSLFSKLNFARVIFQAAIYGLVKAAGAIVFPDAEYRGLGIARCVYPSVMKYMSTRISISSLSAPTRTAIESYCTNKKLSLRSEYVAHGAGLHWVGTTTSSKVLLYFHGGGYHVPIEPKGHIGFALKMAAAADASLVVLEYYLSPAVTYPVPLRQATAALAHLLTIYPASNIIIAGDSAGAHLAAGLLSNFNHPTDKIEPVNLNRKLGGICFISPFVSFDYDKKSFRENAKHDFLTMRHVEHFNGMFKPAGMSDSEAMKDPCLSPGDAPLGWWENAPVERLITVFGTWEIFADDCLAFGERLQSEAGKTSDVKVVACARELHVGAVVDTGFGLEERDMAKAILAWMREFRNS